MYDRRRSRPFASASVSGAGGRGSAYFVRQNENGWGSVGRREPCTPPRSNPRGDNRSFHRRAACKNIRRLQTAFRVVGALMTPALETPILLHELTSFRKKASARRGSSCGTRAGSARSPEERYWAPMLPSMATPGRLCPARGTGSVRKIIPKKIKIELATPASTPRRLNTIPRGARSGRRRCRPTGAPGRCPVMSERVRAPSAGSRG